MRGLVSDQASRLSRGVGQFIYRAPSNGEPDHPAVTVFGGLYFRLAISSPFLTM
jgi:hypothetical protein